MNRTRMNKTNRDSVLTTITCLTAACGLALSGTAAVAQNSGDREQEEYKEWSNEEGVHEEEWYDPTDWWDDDFDGIKGPDTDYATETHWDDDWGVDEWDDEQYAVYKDDAYEYDWWDSSINELRSDGYYDGYIDGYTDDDYGYEVDIYEKDVSTRYQSGYISGYYDGYYDQTHGYASDWTYYIFPYPVDRERAQASRERRGDESRERGDRAGEMGNKDKSRRQAAQEAKDVDTNRVRGTVKKVERLKDSKLSEKMKGHRVVRVTFDDGKTVVADLGKKSEDVKMRQGDRVTIAGERVRKDGRRMLDASRVTVNNEVMWNAKHEAQPERVVKR